MKNIIMFSWLITFCFACSSIRTNKITIYPKNCVDEYKDSLSIKQQDEFGSLYYFDDFVAAKKLYDAQSKEIKSAIVFSSGFESHFTLAEESDDIINKGGGIKELMRQCLSSDNYARIQNKMSFLKFEIVIDQTGRVLGNAVKIIQINEQPIELSRQEVERLLSLGKSFKFKYYGNYKGDFIHLLNLTKLIK